MAKGGPGKSRRSGGGRKRTSVRTLTATPPGLVFGEPATAHADISLSWCPQCGAVWWEPFVATYKTAKYYDEPDANGYYFHELADVERPAQPQQHYRWCVLHPDRKP